MCAVGNKIGYIIGVKTGLIYIIRFSGTHTIFINSPIIINEEGFKTIILCISVDTMIEKVSKRRLSTFDKLIIV